MAWIQYPLFPLYLDWELPDGVIDNLEGQALEDHIARLLEQQKDE